MIRSHRYDFPVKKKLSYRRRDTGLKAISGKVYPGLLGIKWGYKFPIIGNYA